MRWIQIMCVLCAAFISQSAEAYAGKAVFAKHRNRYFIETGSHFGDGVQAALEVGFPHIYSIEIAPFFYEECCKRFQSRRNVKLFLGDSAIVLSEILKNIDGPATFWLDGHYSGGGTGRGETNTPLLAELECIRQHPIKTHTIIIDDVRQFGTADFDFIELNEAVRKILEINPNYQITFENGSFPNDVLIAEIK